MLDLLHVGNGWAGGGWRTDAGVAAVDDEDTDGREGC